MDDFNEISDASPNDLISVIVPVYNVENYLNKCVNSLTAQTHPNLEIILVNDGSTDTSGSLCESWAQKDNRIKVIHQRNSGSSIARNTGLKEAKGNYIGFVDSDDWIDPKMFGSMLQFAKEDQLEVVECSSIESSETATQAPQAQKKTIETTEEAMERIVANHLYAVWRRLYHKSVLKDMLFIPHKIHQDVFYTMDLLKKLTKIGFIDYPFYVYNTANETSIIRGTYSLQKLNAIDAGLYVVEQTKSYNSKVRHHASHYLIKFLTLHYESLFLHPNLDPDFAHRLKIKNLVKNYLDPRNATIYGVMIKILPFKLYSIFLKANRVRINLQIQLFKAIKNV
jgi:glycosyltransferase involved in cell wall biosynthesis